MLIGWEHVNQSQSLQKLSKTDWNWVQKFNRTYIINSETNKVINDVHLYCRKKKKKMSSSGRLKSCGYLQSVMEFESGP